MKDKVKKIVSKENYKGAEGFVRGLLFDKPVLKFIVLIIVQFAASSLNGYLRNVPTRWAFVILNILITIYFISVIIHFARRIYTYLMNPRNLFYLIIAYAGLILIILFVFSTLFNFADITHLGYIRYGQCSDNFNYTNAFSNSEVSRSFFYFSAITFFTVGYGDICPMGLARTVSILDAFVGHIISVMLVALILNNYMRYRNGS